MSGAPQIQFYDGIAVVRDDLFPGGTKARFIGRIFDSADEVVYASPPEGGAQTALAYCARQRGKRATIFVAKRKTPHPRSLMAKALGAKVLQVAPGYLTVVQKRAKDYCAAYGATLAPFGMDVPFAVEAIAEAARLIDYDPAEVWCAGGSGVLARGLRRAWPKAQLHIVQVGRELASNLGRVHIHPLGFSDRTAFKPPFPSDPHYDAKAFEYCQRLASRDGRNVLFWNVTGPATTAATPLVTAGS